MQTTESKTTTPSLQLKTAQSPFFQQERKGDFMEHSKASFFSAGGTQQSFFTKPTLQTKLTIGQPGDKYEQEADQMADQIVQRLAEHNTNSKSNIIQPKCATCQEKEKLQQKEEPGKEEKLQRKPIFESNAEPPELPVQTKLETTSSLQKKCDECTTKEETPGVQRAADSTGTPSASSSLESRLNSSRGGGSPLPENTRTQMEGAFGSNFSGVRVHTDSSAVQMNKELGAQAFTHGSDVYFNAGKYDAGSRDGQRLLAHELTHTVQQSEKGVIACQQEPDPNPTALSLFNHPLVLEPEELKKEILIKQSLDFTAQFETGVGNLEEILNIASGEYDFWLRVRAEPDKIPATEVMMHYLLVNNIYTINNERVSSFVSFLIRNLEDMSQLSLNNDLISNNAEVKNKTNSNSIFSLYNYPGLTSPEFNFEQPLWELENSMTEENFDKFKGFFAQKAPPNIFDLSEDFEGLRIDSTESKDILLFEPFDYQDNYYYDLIKIAKEYQTYFPVDNTYWLNGSIEKLERLVGEHGALYDLVENIYTEYNTAYQTCLDDVGEVHEPDGFAKFADILAGGVLFVFEMENSAKAALQNGQISCDDATGMIEKANQAGHIMMTFSMLGNLIPGAGSTGAKAGTKIAQKIGASALINAGLELPIYAMERSVKFDNPIAQEIWDQNTRDFSEVLLSIGIGSALDLAPTHFSMPFQGGVIANEFLYGDEENVEKSEDNVDATEPEPIEPEIDSLFAEKYEVSLSSQKGDNPEGIIQRVPQPGNQPIRRLRGKPLEDIVASMLRSGINELGGRMNFVIRAQHNKSGHGVDFVCGRVDGNKLLIFRVEVKGGGFSNYEIKLPKTKSGIQSGPGWIKNAVKSIKQQDNSVAIALRRHLERISEKHGIEFNNLLRRLDNARSFVFSIQGANAKMLKKQIAALAGHHGRKRGGTHVELSQTNLKKLLPRFRKGVKRRRRR